MAITHEMDFDTADSGSGDRSYTDNGWTINIKDAGSNVSVAGGVMTIAPSSTAWSWGFIDSNAKSHAVGTAFGIKVRNTVYDTLLLGFHAGDNSGVNPATDAIAGTLISDVITDASGGLMKLFGGTGTLNENLFPFAWQTNQWIELALRMESGGWTLYWKGGPNKTDLWMPIYKIPHTDTNSYLSLGVARSGGTVEVDRIWVDDAFDPQAGVVAADSGFTKKGFHIPSPEVISTTAYVLWQEGTEHTGHDVDIKVGKFESDLEDLASTATVYTGSQSGEHAHAGCLWYNSEADELWAIYQRDQSATSGGGGTLSYKVVNQSTLALGSEQTFSGIADTDALAFSKPKKLDNDRVGFALHTTSGDLYFAYSDDDGATWTKVSLTQTDNGELIEPDFYQQADNSLVMICRSQEGSWAYVAESSDRGATWGVPYIASRYDIPNNGSRLSVTPMADGRILMGLNDLPARSTNAVGRERATVEIRNEDLERQARRVFGHTGATTDDADYLSWIDKAYMEAIEINSEIMVFWSQQHQATGSIGGQTFNIYSSINWIRFSESDMESSGSSGGAIVNQGLHAIESGITA